MRYLLFTFIFTSTFISCSDDCLTCTLQAPTVFEEEYCDDGETNYTDQNGAIITFDEFITQQENVGWICK